MRRAAGLRDKLQAAPAPARSAASVGLFGQRLDLATRIITGRVPVLAVKIALGGFDTHANQAPTHEALLGVLASGLATFRYNMIAAGRWDDVLVLDLFGVRPSRPAERVGSAPTMAPLRRFSCWAAG